MLINFNVGSVQLYTRLNDRCYLHRHMLLISQLVYGEVHSLSPETSLVNNALVCKRKKKKFVIAEHQTCGYYEVVSKKKNKLFLGQNYCKTIRQKRR
jgi:hypothetical protein